MKTSLVTLAVLLPLLTFRPILAQEAAEPVQKDAQGIAIAQQAISAMGGGAARAPQDSVASGTLLLAAPSPLTLPLVMKTSGTRKVRVERQTPKGQRVRILNDGKAARIRTDGTVQWLSTNNTLAERVTHLPSLSLLAEYADPNVNVDYEGSASVNGQAAEVTMLSLASASPDQAEWVRETTGNRFFVDRVSGTVLKLEYTNFAENNPDARSKVEIFFNDYRQVDGVWVPFRQTTYLDGKLESELMLNSVAFNVGVADSEFDLPKSEVDNAE